jgi:mono/diheme cytochrome c family protein
VKVSKIAALFRWPGKEYESGSSGDGNSYEISADVLARGRNLYLTICASCHGNDGKGITRFGPPLTNSEWVLGQPERLARILLHGMEGPVEVNERVFAAPDILPAMPAFATTPPEDLAAIMTYIRQEWGHNASPVKPGTVGRIRVLSQGKVKPWTVEELQKEYLILNDD